MVHEPDNPYRSPQATCEPFDQPPPSPSDPRRFDCPQCQFRFSFWKVYWRQALGTFSCPQCDARLKAAKMGIGRWFTTALGFAFGLVAGLLASLILGPDDSRMRLPSDAIGRYWLIPLFFIAVALAYAAGYFIDRRYTYLRLKDPSPSKGEGREA
jgi:hypothetical protein